MCAFVGELVDRLKAQYKHLWRLKVNGVCQRERRNMPDKSRGCLLKSRCLLKTLKSLLQHHSSKASILGCSVFFIVQPSHPYTTTGKSIALTRQIFVGKVMSLLFNKLSRLVWINCCCISDVTPKQTHYFAHKSLYSQSYGFSSSHVWMWELDDKEGWVLKNWYFWTVVLEKTLESPLDCKEIQPVHPKGNQAWIFIGNTETKAEAPVLWPPNVNSQLIGKDPDARKDWRQEEKGMTEYEMAGWHHWLNGHKFEQVLGGGEGQGGLSCCNPSGCRVGHSWAIEQQQNVRDWNKWTCTVERF